MVCRLCLTESDKFILIFSEQNIKTCISKFLNLEVTLEDPVSKVICTLCWQQLEDFRNFCFRIEEAQKTISVLGQEWKEEVRQFGGEASFESEPPLECVTAESDSNQLKEEEDFTSKSEDETLDNSDTFHYVHDEPVKVEHNKEDDTKDRSATPAEDVEPPPTRRITRGSQRQQLTPEKSISSEEATKRNLVRSKKEKSEAQPTLEKSERDESVEDDTIPNVNAKRRRGRPKKGEERPKVEKVRSEKGERILETAREFDGIIQKNMNLVCNICSVNLIDFAELKRHFRVIHNRKGYAVCCNKRLYKRGLVVDHINKHNNSDYFKCTQCGKVMADRMCLRNHVLLMHQNEDVKVYQCPYCPKKYAKQYLLAHHQVKHVPQAECTFICAECGKGFPTKTTLTKHLNQIHSTIYDKMCEICAKLIRGNAAFERHMEDHEGVVRPQVQCEICGSWLKDKNSLRKHMYKHDGKTYTCSLCGKIAPSKSALQSHCRYVHQTVRQFHCTFCDKSFKKAVNLREHLTTHTGEVLYTCPHCPKTFNSKANMHAHRKKKHRAEWEANRRYNIKQAPTTETKSELS